MDHEGALTLPLDVKLEITVALFISIIGATLLYAHKVRNISMIHSF